jgi:hypothetical protein
MFRYILNILMGLSFLVLFVTGLLKFPELQIMFSLYQYPLPWRMISYWHDWSGVALGVLILVHLWLNRRWFGARTKSLFMKKQASQIDMPVEKNKITDSHN